MLQGHPGRLRPATRSGAQRVDYVEWIRTKRGCEHETAGRPDDERGDSAATANGAAMFECTSRLFHTRIIQAPCQERPRSVNYRTYRADEPRYSCCGSTIVAEPSSRRTNMRRRRGVRRPGRTLGAPTEQAVAVVATRSAALGRSVDRPHATGDDVVGVALAHIGERYVLGARAPMASATWKGPWDCAELASWCVYRASGILYGVRPTDDPVMADAYTGYWAEQAERDAATVRVEHAVRIVGACLLRKPRAGPIGHIAISTGDGKTIEAHSAKHGVSRHSASNRRWDYGVLVPGITYFLSERVVHLRTPARIIRLTTPLTRGAKVEQVQKKLLALGYSPGAADGIYGPQSAAAVMEFQADRGLVADGEVGNVTLKALGIRAKHGR